MQPINLNGIEKISEKFNELLEKFPEMRRKYHEEVAKETQNLVKGGFGNGKVASWQEKHVGSRGGYAAVRPKANTFYANYAAGQITNAIDSGHRTRPASQKRHRPRANYVSGKHVYIDKEVTARIMAERKAAEMVREIESRFRNL